MNKRFLIISLAVLVGGVGIYILSDKKPTEPTPQPVASSLPQLKIGNTTIFAEIADTPNETVKGLSNRESLPWQTGLLFYFSDSQLRYFWMKDMLFPLDFLWIQDGLVVTITENVPPPAPNTPDEKLAVVNATQPVSAVLELNAGFVKQAGIKIGDKVEFVDTIVAKQYPL